MSFKVTQLVRDARLPRTVKRRPLVKAVLSALADRCDDQGLNAWPALATIAGESEIGTRTTQRCLDTLRELNLIDEQEPPRQHRPRTWLLRLDKIAALSGLQHDARLSPSATQDPACLTSSAARRTTQEQVPEAHIRTPDLQVASPDPHIFNSDTHAGAKEQSFEQSFEPSLEPSVRARPIENEIAESDEQVRRRHLESMRARLGIRRARGADRRHSALPSTEVTQ